MKYLAAILLMLSFNTQAAVVSITHDWPIMAIGDTGNHLTGRIAVGDRVHVEAFYNTDSASLLFTRPFAAYYAFPPGQAGLSFTINNLRWETTGPLTVSVWPVNVTKGPERFGGPIWDGYTSENIQGIVPTTISSPIDVGGVRGQAMLFHPIFPRLSDTNLPTSFDSLASTWGFTGTIAVASMSGTEYRCHFGEVPIPASLPLALSGLLGLVAVGRKKLNG